MPGGLTAIVPQMATADQQKSRAIIVTRAKSLVKMAADTPSLQEVAVVSQTFTCPGYGAMLSGGRRAPSGKQSKQHSDIFPGMAAQSMAGKKRAWTNEPFVKHGIARTVEFACTGLVSAFYERGWRRRCVYGLSNLRDGHRLRPGAGATERRAAALNLFGDPRSVWHRRHADDTAAMSSQPAAALSCRTAMTAPTR